MDKLVYLEPNCLKSEPFTTSETIAQYAQIKKESIDRLIRSQQSALEAFGLVGFEIRANQTVRGIREEKVYHLNEQQATLLITFLKNTEPVVAFKTELVRQFYAMRKELQRREMLRVGMKPIRRELTDVIRDRPDASKWDYKLFTDLAYKTVIGRNAAQVRKDRGAKPEATAIDYMTSEEIAAVAKLQSQIAVLLEMGMCYQQIKMMLLNRQVVGNIA
jgi:phage regulator Rha-like protein